MKDRFGREFEVGARVVYAMRDSLVGLQTGIIRKVKDTTKQRYNRETRQNEEVPWCHLQIEIEHEQWDGTRIRRNVTLHCVDRVVVVP